MGKWGWLLLLAFTCFGFATMLKVWVSRHRGDAHVPGLTRCKELESIFKEDEEKLQRREKEEWQKLGCTRLIQIHSKHDHMRNRTAIAKGRGMIEKPVGHPQECPPVCRDASDQGDWTNGFCVSKPSKSNPSRGRALQETRKATYPSKKVSSSSPANTAAPASSCGSTFTPIKSRCLYQFFSDEDTHRCLEDKWIVILGGSAAMNLGLTWMMRLDAAGTAPPFNGPKWYNLSCNSDNSCSPAMNKMQVFLDFPNMGYDLIVGSNGRTLYKSGDLPLSKAPRIPRGGWRLTVKPARYAHEVVTYTKEIMSLYKKSGMATPPIVYAQVGQWYLNGYAGASKAWGYYTKEVKVLERLETPFDVWKVYEDDLLKMSNQILKLGVHSLGIATMPVFHVQCTRANAGVGCRMYLNTATVKVVEDLRAKKLPVYHVDWEYLTGDVEQGGAHSDHKAGVVGIQRMLSTWCSPPVAPGTPVLAPPEGVPQLIPPNPSNYKPEGRAATKAITDGLCGTIASFGSTCSAHNDWRTMIGRRCEWRIIPLNAEQAWTVLEDGVSLPQPQSIPPPLSPTTIDLAVHHAISIPVKHVSPALIPRQTLYLLASLLVATVMFVAAYDRDLPSSLLFLRRWIRYSSRRLGVLPRRPSAGDNAKDDAAPGTPSKPLDKERQTDVFDAFHAVRLLATVHITVHYLSSHCPPAMKPTYVTGWAETWISFMVMSSGYKLTLSSLFHGTSKTPKPSWTFAYDNLVVFYPMYIVSCAVALVMSSSSLSAVLALRPTSLVSQLFLTQAWLPSEVEGGVLPHTWFFSVLLPMWLAHGYMTETVLSMPMESLLCLVGASTMLPWALFPYFFAGLPLPPIPVPPSSLPALSHALASTHANLPHDAHGDGISRSCLLSPAPPRTWEEVLVAFLRYHPLSYLPMYFSGMCFAAVWARLFVSKTLHYIRYGAPVALLILGFIFSSPSFEPAGIHRIIWSLGALIPVHGLLLLGLTAKGREGALVITLLKHPIVTAISSPAMAMYIIHPLCFRAWGGHTVGPAFWVFLFACSMAVSQATNLLGAQNARRAEICTHYLLGAAGVLLALSFSVPDGTLPRALRSLYGKPAKPAGSEPHLGPASVTYERGIVDFRIPLRVAEGWEDEAFQGWAGGGHGYRIINPTFASDPDDPNFLWVGARVHRKDIADSSASGDVLRGRGGANQATLLWNTGIVVGSLAVAEFVPNPSPMSLYPAKLPLPHDIAKHNNKEWMPCIPPKVFSSNGTMTVTRSTGPEDPRIQFNSQNELVISTFSYLPSKLSSKQPQACANPKRIGSMFESKGPLTEEAWEGSWSRNLTSKFSTVELPYAAPDANAMEKNWMRFEHRGKAYYIRSISPTFLILRETAHGNYEEVVRTKLKWFGPKKRDGKEGDLIPVNGGSNPVLVEGRRWGDEGRYYLATFHTRQDGGRYQTYAYAFQADRPFGIIGLSARLPLDLAGKHDGMVFQSGLAVVPDSKAMGGETGTGTGGQRVLFGYGAGDSESRVLSVPLDIVEEWVFHDGGEGAWPLQVEGGVQGEEGKGVWKAELREGFMLGEGLPEVVDPKAKKAPSLQAAGRAQPSSKSNGPSSPSSQPQRASPSSNAPRSSSSVNAQRSSSSSSSAPRASQKGSPAAAAGQAHGSKQAPRAAPAAAAVNSPSSPGS